MTVVVNGREEELPAGANVRDLAVRLAADRPGTAFAVGGSVVPRGQWQSHVLQNGDVVEVITAVQGG